MEIYIWPPGQGTESVQNKKKLKKLAKFDSNSFCYILFVCLSQRISLIW